MEEITLVTGFSIDELAIPETLDAPDAGDFIEMTRVRNRIEAESAGSYDLAMMPSELLPAWRAQAFEVKRMFVARVDGAIVGRAIVELPLGTPIAWITVEVLAEHRGRGIGSALYATIEQVAVAADTPVLQGYVIQGESGCIDRIIAPTGFGTVPRDSPATRFALARGFRLEQVARMSRLELPADRRVLRRRYLQASAATGDGYHVAYWSGATPDEHLAQVAELRARLATDAPQAGLEPDTSPWSAERVRAQDLILSSSPRTRLSALVEHVATGEAAGYTELDVPREVNRPVRQGDTIVLQPHRGRRLGMVLKAGNLLRLGEAKPGHPAVLTFTAEENRHMIAVNEALGFLPWGSESAWKKTLR
ncbi:GNAT superfamily N-acetyltransferase [Conyzicola nivalis]|uniref:GNAT superfamily N-acetyltransferase n=1 Tax=Conyzicola nivalis TaxID=1477021 RepID=A0ABV2QM86_9MICO